MKKATNEKGRRNRNLTSILTIFFVASMSVATANFAAAASDGDEMKIELFNLIANDEHQYGGVGPLPEVPLLRWGAKLQMLGIAPGRETELAHLSDEVLAPLIADVTSMELAEFPGVALKVADDNPNVLVLVGDEFAPFREKLPQAGLKIWQQLFDTMERARAGMPYASCIYFIADDGNRSEIAAMMFISTRPNAGDPEACAAQSFGNIIGLRGKAMPEMSIISSTQSLDSLRPLDRKALQVIYGRSRVTNRSVSQAIDEYLSD